MAFKMKYNGSSFPFKKDDSPTTELLDVLRRYGDGTEYGTIGGREMTANELAANRYLTKQIQKVPEEHRSDFAYTLNKGRLEGDTMENQAKVLWEMQNK
jgi:hypothetical protein